MSYIAAKTLRDGATTVVFTFHGTGGNEQQFHRFATEQWPDASIVSPRGDVSEMGALRFFRRRAEGLYDMDDLAKRSAAMTAFLTEMKEETGATRAIGLGYSNGANIMAAVSFTAPDIFDDLILMHPLIPWTPDPQAGLGTARVLITAGHRDPICPAPQTEALADYYTANKADVTMAWHEGGHEIRDNEVEAIRIFAG